MKRTAPAALRNADAIGAVLREVLPASGTVLELGSGTGEHAVRFAAAFPALAWQPSDPDPAARDSIAAWAEEARLPNLRPPLHYDLRVPRWTARSADALLCVNVLHVAPPDGIAALAAGAARLLPPGGPLVVYGPFSRGEADPAAARARLARIDANVRAADPGFGVRPAAALLDACTAAGLDLAREVAMPEDGDRLLVFRRR